jgi:hypothetical protein
MRKCVRFSVHGAARLESKEHPEDQNSAVELCVQTRPKSVKSLSAR